MSAADPWIGELIAVRSAKPRKFCIEVARIDIWNFPATLKEGLYITLITRFPHHSLHIVLDARVAFEVGLNVGLGFFFD